MRLLSRDALLFKSKLGWLNRQLCAPFSTTALNNSAAALWGDTSTKPVSTGAVSSMWLVCSLWHIWYIVANFSVFRKSLLKDALWLSTDPSTLSTSLYGMLSNCGKMAPLHSLGISLLLWLWKTSPRAIVEGVRDMRGYLLGEGFLACNMHCGKVF